MSIQNTETNKEEGERERERERERESREWRDWDLPLKNLGGEELDFEIGKKGVMMTMMIGSEDGGGDIPSKVGLLELDEPLISSHAVAGLRVMIEDVNSLGDLDLQLHLRLSSK